MTYDKPRCPKGHVLTFVHWERVGDHCRVRETRSEVIRRVRPEPEAPVSIGRGALAAERQGSLL